MKRFLYELGESWKIAAAQKRSNMTRSTLTALGVIIGIVAVTLMGAQYATRAVLPFMIRQRNGSIINFSSVHGLVGGRNSAADASIKSALLGFTRSVAYDYGAFNIRVNALCPGVIQSGDAPAAGGEPGDYLSSKTFLGRAGQLHDVAYAALFLASDEASYITGAIIPVDGGWTAM